MFRQVHARSEVQMCLNMTYLNPKLMKIHRLKHIGIKLYLKHLGFFYLTTSILKICTLRNLTLFPDGLPIMYLVLNFSNAIYAKIYFLYMLGCIHQRMPKITKNWNVKKKSLLFYF